jgi:hypothetical protein
VAREEDLHGDCSEATHIVTGLTVGAFALSAGGAVDVGGGGTAFGVGARMNAKNERETLSRDGDPRMCAKATLDDTQPPRWCGAVVRVEVVTIARALHTLNVPDVDLLSRDATSTVTEPKPPVAIAPPAPIVDRAIAPRSAPGPCDGSSIADCMTRCTDGSGPSCLKLAHAASDRDRTYWFLYACMGGSAEGCTGVGRAYARGEFGTPDDFTAEKWYGIATRRAGLHAP